MRQLEVRRVTSLTRMYCSFCFVCGLKRDLVVVVCVVGVVLSLLCCTPFSLLAVFHDAPVFNQDVSKWNTGAVTTMESSKCTLSFSLWPRRLPLCCVNSRSVGSQKSHTFCSFCVCGLQRDLFCCLCGGFGLSFLCCTLHFLYCSVFSRICVQFRRVGMEYRGGDKYVIQ